MFSILWLGAVGCGSSEPADAADADPTASDADPHAPDADPNASDADPNAPDADPNAPDGGEVGVECGDMTCADTQECCVTGGPAGSSECVDAGTCEGAVIDCDGPEDCADGEACCGSSAGTQCQPADSCGAILCHDAGDCPDEGDECCGIGGSMICAAFCPGP